MITDICQTNILWEDKKSNIEKAESIISNSNAHIVLFPEMSFTGFSMNTNVTGESDYATLNTMKKIAKKYAKAVAFGWTYKADGKAENHYTVVNHEGNVISDYVKLHPFSYSGEDKYFNKGSSIAQFNFSGFNISTFICYDLRFGNVFALASENADIITVAANWPASRSDHWKTLLKARAIENQCYILGINCVGNIGGQYYSGDSCAIAPDGRVISSLSDREGVITLELNNDVKAYRESFPVRADRRDELYAELT